MAERFRPNPKELAGGRAVRPDSRFRKPRIIERGQEEDLETLVNEACLEEKTGVDIGKVLLKITEFLDDEALDILYHCVKQRALSDLRKFVDNIGKKRKAYAAVCRTINEELLNDQAKIDWEKIQLQLGMSPLSEKP